MKNLILTIGTFAFLLSGCAMRTKVLDAAAISMTRSNLNPGETLKEAGPVNGKFCVDTWNDKGSIGLIDNAVTAAQKQSQVDFILSASFWQEGGCIDVEGTGAKIVTANNTSAPAAAPRPSRQSERLNKNLRSQAPHPRRLNVSSSASCFFSFSAMRFSQPFAIER
jgi:hypothetical protein